MMYSPINQISKEISDSDELDTWFNELDEKTIEIINNNLIKEEEVDGDGDYSLNNAITEPDNNDNDSDGDDNKNETITKCICVDDILKKNPEILSSNELIRDECSIAYFIQVLMEGSTANKIRSTKIHDTELTYDKMQNIIEYLHWISLASENLAKRIKQELLIYHPEQKPAIIRSSYNFCTKYTQCKNFYSRHETPNCKEHHYVHSLLKYDVDSVIVFLKYIIKNNLTISKEELNNLYLSIKTICFVTRHMAKEINYIDYITKNNSETFHRNNPIELNRKKIIPKKIWNDDDKYNRNDKSPNHDEDTSFDNATTSKRGTFSNGPRGTFSNPARGTFSNPARGTSGNSARGTFNNPTRGTSGNGAIGTIGNASRGTFNNSTRGTFSNAARDNRTRDYPQKNNNSFDNKRNPIRSLDPGNFKKSTNITINKSSNTANNMFTVLSEF